MMKTSLFYLIMISITVTSCQKEDKIDLLANDDIKAAWISPQFTDSTITYTKSADLKENEYGIAFYSAGKLTERKNAGWCGTPPVTYGDFEGSWVINNNLLEIKVAYWGGTADYKWKILSMDNNQLKVKQIDVFFHPANQ